MARNGYEESKHRRQWTTGMCLYAYVSRKGLSRPFASTDGWDQFEEMVSLPLTETVHSLLKKKKKSGNIYLFPFYLFPFF